MIVHLPKRFRIYLALFLVVIVASVLIIKSNSGTRLEYQHTTGRLSYLSKNLGDLPSRDFGKFRYLKIENYQYPFEIYADDQGARLDSLKINDIVTAYFFETSNTREERLNRFLQYLDKDEKPYFQRTNFMIELGYVLIALSMLAILFFYVIYKKRKIPY